MQTLMIAEDGFWAPGADFAAAMHHRGYRTIRLLADAQDDLVGATVRLAVEELASDVVFDAVTPSGALTDAGLAALRQADPIDLQGTEPVLEWLSDRNLLDLSGPRRSSRLPLRSVIDKVLLSRYLEAAGIAVPQLWDDVSQVPGSAAFPLLVKLRNGGGGMGIILCHSFDELRAAADSLQGAPLFVQEFHDGPTLDVAGIAKDGEVIDLITYENVVDPAHPFAFAYGIKVTEDEPLADYTREVVAALGITGPFALDAVPDDHGRPLLIDANLRIWGCWTACQDAGLDVLGSYEFALGLGPRPPAPRLTPGSVHSLLRTPPLGVRGGAARTRWLRRELQAVRRRSPWMGQRWARATSLRLTNWAVRGRVLPS